MARVSKTSPFQSQRQTQQASNTEGEKKEDEEEKKEESKGDDEEKGTSSISDEKKKGKRPMKGKKRKKRTKSIGKTKQKGVEIGVGATAATKESDGESEQKPPAAKRRKYAETKVKSSYSLRSRKIGPEEKEPEGKEKEQETAVSEANPDADEKGKNVAEESNAEGSDNESE